MNSQIIKFLFLISCLIVINACAFRKKEPQKAPVYTKNTVYSTNKAGLRDQFPVSKEDSIIDEQMRYKRHIRYYFYYKYNMDLSIAQADSVVNTGYKLDTADFNRIRREQWRILDQIK